MERRLRRENTLAQRQLFRPFQSSDAILEQHVGLGETAYRRSIFLRAQSSGERGGASSRDERTSRQHRRFISRSRLSADGDQDRPDRNAEGPDAVGANPIGAASA